MSSAPRIPRRVWFAAAASGAAALLYQMGWLRLLIPQVGATWPAITLVLAGFMAGLGLGANLGGRLADTLPPGRLARAYAGVEVAIVLVGLLVPFLGEALARLPFPAVGPLSGRALAAGVLVALPAIAMGATSPLLVVLGGTWTPAGARGGGAWVPLLYAVNAGGAVLGALGGGLWLPFAVGLPLLLALAAALNLLAAGLVGGLGVGPSPVAPPPPEAADPEDEVPVAALVALAFGSGFLSLMGETVWTRSLAQIDATLYDGHWLQPGDVLAVVLAQVLLGQAVGGLVAATRASRAARARTLLRWLGATLLVGGLLSLATLEVVSVSLSGTTVVQEAPAWGLALRLLLVLPAGVALGTTFPLLGALVGRSHGALGRRIGRLWALNTAGTVQGSVFAGAFVLPVLGSGRGVVAAAGLAVVLAGAALFAARPRGSRLAWPELGGLGVAAAVVGGIALLAPLGPGRALALKYGEDAIVAAWEGWEATTVVVEPRGLPRGIVTNGHAILGNVAYAARAEELAALAPEAHRALLVGFGTGNFARSLLRRNHLSRLEVVEIDGFQFRAAELFGTGSVLEDKRVGTVVDDALHFLATHDETWDLIAVDAWGPDRSPTLYTVETHALAAAHLAPGGLFWAKLVGTTPASTRALVDAARCAWPHAWVHAPPDVALVGSLEPRELAGPFEALPPADADCHPHSRLHPARIRAVTGGGRPEPGQTPPGARSPLGR